jgi:hypothetical protein
LINRSWLKYDESKNEMYCTSYKQDKVESVFTKGTYNFKLEAIKQHENSKAHLLYIHKLDTESINKPETSKALALCSFSAMFCLETLAMDLTNMEQALSLL